MALWSKVPNIPEVLALGEVFVARVDDFFLFTRWAVFVRRCAGQGDSFECSRGGIPSRWRMCALILQSMKPKSLSGAPWLYVIGATWAAIPQGVFRRMLYFHGD